MYVLQIFSPDLLLVFLFPLYILMCMNLLLFAFIVSTLLGFNLRNPSWTSLVMQWLRIRLPMQGTRVQALVWEDPTCRRTTKPVCHNY